MDALLVVAFHTISDAALGEDLHHFAAKFDDVVIARILPATTALVDGIGVHAFDVVA